MSSTSATPAVPATKLHPPSAGSTQVARADIAERIAAAGAARLVLVRAPAGFGKTTAMQQARESLDAAGTATAWLTLDRADNDVPRFLACLGAAVAHLGLEGATASQPLSALQALADEEQPFVLFLDDFEHLQEPAVLGLVRQVLEQLPRAGRLVIGSRSLPDLGLGRLRARGQLLEVDTSLLRFSLADTAEFLRLRTGQPLAPATVARLHGKTEGWITALWLVSMALARHGAGSAFVERVAGLQREVADYLAEDVLAHQSAEVRGFLLRTSILRHLDAAVCQALLPQADCAALLRQLEQAHLFLTPLDDEPGSYRYHSLFADFLRAQLARELPGEAARLHLAAAGWYAAQGRPVPAIDHAIEGGDHGQALALLEQHALHFLEQGRMRLLARWFTALPAVAVRERPLLQVVALWALCFTRGPWDAVQAMDASGCANATDPAVQAHVNALRPMLLVMRDRHAEAYEAGRASLSRLPTGQAFPDTVLSNAMAHITAVMGQQHEAHRLLDAARRTQAGSAFNRMYTETLEGVLDLKEGRLRQATARLRIAVGATPHAASYAHTNGNAWAGVAYAEAVYEAGALEQAEHLLSVYLPLACDVGLPDHMIAGHRMRARIAFQHGDIDAALQLLIELEYLGHQRQLPRVVASAKLERARMLVLQGHGLAARDELARADDAAVWSRVAREQLPAHDLEDLLVGQLRWDIHYGDVQAALVRLAPATHAAQAANRQRRKLKLEVLRALALRRTGDAPGAVAALREVLLAASREGFMRLLLDEGLALGPLLQRVQAAWLEQGAADDPLLLAHLQRLLAQFPPEEAEAEPQAIAGPAEPLTRKEIHVLQLLAEGYSNRAMAEKLFVSDSTVRTHLRNINGKLDARSRTQAVAVARRLGVIR